MGLTFGISVIYTGGAGGREQDKERSADLRVGSPRRWRSQEGSPNQREARRRGKHRGSAATLKKNLPRAVVREHLPTRRRRELVRLPSSRPKLLLFYSLLSSSITRAAGGTRRMWRFHWIKNLRAIKSGPTPGIHQPRRAAASRGVGRVVGGG